MKRWIQLFSQTYLTLRPFERSGRFWEFFGIHIIDPKIAKVFGEKPIVRWKPGLTESRDRLIDARARGYYSEVVNAVCVVIYALMGVHIWIQNIPWLFVYNTITLLVTHFQVIPIERYKRALVAEWLEHPELLTEPAPEMPPTRDPAQLNHWFFSPKRMESERFYDRLGVKSYKAYVRGLTFLATPPPDIEVTSLHTVKSRNRAYLDGFEAQTRTSEKVHWIGIVQHLPYFWLFFMRPSVGWGLTCLLLLYLNVYAIFLQRQHRARLWRVLTKPAKRGHNEAQA